MRLRTADQKQLVHKFWQALCVLVSLFISEHL